MKSLVKDQTGPSNPFGCPHVTTQANAVCLELGGDNRGPRLCEMKVVFSPLSHGLRVAVFSGRSSYIGSDKPRVFLAGNRLYWGGVSTGRLLSLLSPLNLLLLASQRLAQLHC